MEHRQRRFTTALETAHAAGRVPLISEIKVRSPKEGDLLAGRAPVALARSMEAAGAACLSVVTEGPHFGGNLDLLHTLSSAVSLPILRKDFVTAREDVWATRDHGASCLLLMVAVLDWPQLVELHEEARRCGLETLVEVHDEHELRQALTLDLDLLGINNRDIRQLETDCGTVANTLRLLRSVPAGIRTISESAITTPEEARSVIEAGGAGVLVGTSILQADDVSEGVRRMVLSRLVSQMVRVKICGNTDAKQVAWCATSGADCVGLVVEYPGTVPWNLSREQARDLLTLVPPLMTCAVVTGGDAEHVLRLARYLAPHLIQLHTDNTLEETARIARELASLRIGVIRALRIDVATGQACGGISDPLQAALALQETGIAAVLLDARTEKMPAGTGVSVDWGLALAVRQAVALPLILAGGLTPQNVRSAVDQVRPYAVDVISGVEVSRAVKSPELIRQFVLEAKATSGSESAAAGFVAPRGCSP